MPAIRSGTGESHFPSTAWAALPANKLKEKKMKTPKYEIEIKEPKTIGKTRAYVTVKLGPVWISCRLDESKGKFFLNPPANFVESLQGRELAGGRVHSGWIDTAGFDSDFKEEVRQRALAELGLKEAA